MTTEPMFAGFDGLMTLSRREGVDIRPTLLRVLTDLYVQAGTHNADEERQFVELTSRLVDEVDDATRAAVSARLSIYPHTPAALREKLGLRVQSEQKTSTATATAPAPIAAIEIPPVIAAKPMPDSNDAALIHEAFFKATASERAAILNSLADTSLKQAGRTDARRRQRSIEALEMAAVATDSENFTREIGDALLIPHQLAVQIVSDRGGEPLACAMKALGMPSEVYQRVLMFLDPQIGSSVMTVFRLARLYDHMSEQAALIMLGIWRNTSAANTRARFRPSLHDDERHRARPTFGQVRPAQPRSLQSEKTTVRR